jgi:DNA-binding NarL/FixJ family response regulator
MIRDILQTKDIDVLILDLELEGLSSIFEVKSILKTFQRQNYNIQWSFRTDLCQMIKAGVSGYVHKTEN